MANTEWPSLALLHRVNFKQITESHLKYGMLFLCTFTEFVNSSLMYGRALVLWANEVDVFRSHLFAVKLNDWDSNKSNHMTNNNNNSASNSRNNSGSQKYSAQSCYCCSIFGHISLILSALFINSNNPIEQFTIQIFVLFIYFSFGLNHFQCDIRSCEHLVWLIR